MMDLEPLSTDLEAFKLSPKGSNRDLETAVPSTTSSIEAKPLNPTSDWDTSKDPANPRNWSLVKKIFHTAIPALYGFVITVGTSSYVPAIPYIQKEFGVSRLIAVLPFSFFALGFVFGPVIAAPMSELYGRRSVYWATLPLLLIFAAVAGSSNSIAVLIVARFLGATGGSGALAVGAGTLADLWDPHSEGGKAVLGFIMAPFLGTTLGQLVGAYIISQYDNDWRYSMWVVLMIGAPIAIMACFMSETSKERILYLRDKKRGEKVLHQQGDTMLLLRSIRQAIVRPVHMMFVEPLVGVLSLYTGFAFAMMFSFLGSYNFVFQSIYHFNAKEVGLAFLGIQVGFVIAVASFGIFDATLYKKAVAKASNGIPAPENRLYAAMVGSVMLPIGLFWFAWAPRENVHWIVPILAGVPFGWGCLAIFMSSTTYLVDVYGARYGSSAMAANGILRYGLGAIFPLFTIQMYEALGVGWAGSVFAFVSLAMLPVPWAFFKWGESLRSKSRYVGVSIAE